MSSQSVLAIDLGQSGTSLQIGQVKTHIPRGKLAGESTVDALRAVFELMEPAKAGCVALSCSGLYGVVTEPEKYLAVCNEFFDASEVAVIDDGFAGFVGALKNRDGVVLTIGGGVVSIGGLDGKFAHRDGLGSTFGDEGGGFWLGKAGITKALAVRQGRGEDPEMAEFFKDEINQYFDLSIRDGSDAQTLAIKSAKRVLDAADAGVSTATAIVDEGAYLLAQTVVATWYGCGGGKNDSCEIVIKGGPAGNASYATKIAQEIHAKLPFAVVVESAGDNLDGAIWIAKTMAQDVPPLLMWAR